MKHLHTALQIKNESEITAFYENILGFERQYDFILDDCLTEKIFGRKRQVKVFNIRREFVVLELFIDPHKEYSAAYTHICFGVSDKNEIIQKAFKADFEVVEVQRIKGSVYFIKDYSGNIFEIKDVNIV